MTILISYLKEYKHPIRGGLIAVLISITAFWAIYGGFFYSDTGIFRLARLELDIYDKQRAFEGKVVENMTILEALQASAVAGNIRFEYSIDSGKFTVKSLDGYDSDRGRLVFYVNSRPFEADDIHSVVIQPGDIIIVKAE